MRKWALFPAWSRIVAGETPFLSLEITRECPLNCPGCYAYQPDHAGSGVSLRQIAEYRGKDLVKGVLDLTGRIRPLHVSLVGGEPLLRWRELDELLPELNRRGIEVQLVTSAVLPVPPRWAELKMLHLVVSVDGIEAEHDKRRHPATYDRILANIRGHTVIVHCTVTRRMIGNGDLREFAQFWSARGEVRKIWFSLYSPQENEESEERLRPQDRLDVVKELGSVREQFPKVQMPKQVRQALLRPPQSPEQCLFAQVTTCLSADFKTRIMPCQMGGRPVCEECGCMAAAGLAAVGNFRLGGLVPIFSIFTLSRRIGRFVGGR
ncbi:MAG: radical SAM protein [Acidobacteria bacterium]|nr:radical SAM protein [Acidobacteriota bacterium]